MDSFINEVAGEYFCGHRKGPREKVDFVSFEITKDEETNIGTNSSGVSGKILYRKNGELCRTELLYVKFLQCPEQSPPFYAILWFDKEILFFTKIAPLMESIQNFQHLIPKFLHYGDRRSRRENGEIQMALLFENLAAQGFVNRDDQSLLDFQHMSLMMRKIGEFHAFSYALKKHASDAYQKFRLESDNTIVCSRKIFLEIGDVLNRGLQPLREDDQFIGHVLRIESIIRSIENSPSNYEPPAPADDKNLILVHRSFTQFNVLFRYENGQPADLKLMDWQTWGFASIGCDLMGTLYADVDAKVRDEYWDQLLEEYYNALSTTFSSVQVPSKEEIFAEMKDNVIVAMSMVGYRVRQGHLKADSTLAASSQEIWSIQFITEMFVDLIKRGLI